MSDGGVERDIAAQAGIDDARLASLLKEAGSPLSGEDAVNLLVGAASAPERFGE